MYLGPIEGETLPTDCPPKYLDFTRGSRNGDTEYEIQHAQQGPWQVGKVSYSFHRKVGDSREPPPDGTFAEAAEAGRNVEVRYSDEAPPDDQLNVGDALIVQNEVSFPLTVLTSAGNVIGGTLGCA